MSEIIVNGETSLLEQETLERLIAARIGETRRVAVALNGAVVPRGAWRETRLNGGDRVEIIKVTVGG
jgi:sulfur carrier protein